MTTTTQPSGSQAARLRVSMTVNGTRRDDDVEPRLLLVHYIRHFLGLTGTNVGCDTSSCGACTVLIDGEAVKSCTVLAVQAEGSDITTIEALASAGGELHPVQEAFHAHHGLQCGFCTPGMVLAVLSLLTQNPHPSEAEVRRGLEGNLCRCTGYHNIVKAVLAAASATEAGTPEAGGTESTETEAAETEAAHTESREATRPR